MMKNKLLLCILIATSANAEVALNIEAFKEEARKVYEQIKVDNPSERDWEILQDYLQNGKRAYLEFCERQIGSSQRVKNARGCLAHRMRGIKLYDGPGSIQEIHEAINVPKDNKSCAVISYASLNSNYTTCLKEIPMHLRKNGFRGHFFGQVGGWPNIAGGDLKLAHIPYSFKTCMFRAAKRRGYRYVLWIDSAMYPRNSLDTIFKEIRKSGYYFSRMGFSMKNFCGPNVQKAYSLSKWQVENIPYIAAGIQGYDLKNPKIMSFLGEMHQTAIDMKNFLSPRPEQVVLSVLAHRHHLKPQVPLVQAVKNIGLIRHAWSG